MITYLNLLCVVASGSMAIAFAIGGNRFWCFANAFAAAVNVFAVALHIALHQ